MVLTCGLAAAQKPAPPKAAPMDKKEAETTLVKAGELRGEIIHIEPQKQSFRLKVTVQWVEINPGALQGIQQARIDLARAGDLNARNNALRAMAQHQANLYQPKSTTRDLDIEAAEDLVVRMTSPKVEFDDMGNLKKLTAKELAEKRGKDRLFDGEWSDLVNGMQVQVTLVAEEAPQAQGQGRHRPRRQQAADQPHHRRHPPAPNNPRRRARVRQNAGEPRCGRVS